MAKHNTNKKGQTTFNSGTLLALIIGVGVAVLVLILISVMGGKTYQTTEDDINAITGLQSVTGDTFTLTNNTIIQLDNNDINSGSLVVYNNSGAPFTAIGLSNFTTIDYGAGRLTVTLGGTPDAGQYAGLAVAANYTHGSNAIKHGIGQSILGGFEGLQQTGELLPLIVLAFVMVFILSLVMGLSVLGGKGNMGSGGSAL